MCEQDSCVTVRELRAVGTAINTSCIYVAGAPGQSYGNGYDSVAYDSPPVSY